VGVLNIYDIMFAHNVPAYNSGAELAVYDYFI